jgi:hypothetical protein
MRLSRSISNCLAAITLAACGGGGGGGDAGSGGGPGTAPPISTNAGLVEANAVEALKIVFGSLEQISVAHDLVSLSRGLLAGQTTAAIPCEGNPVVTVQLTNTDPDGNARPSMGDTLTWQHPACGGVTRRISITLASGPLQLTQGRVQIDVEIGGPTPRRVQGNFDLRLGPGPLTWQVTDVHFVVTHGGLSHTLEMASAARSYGQFIYSVSLEGSVDSPSVGGRFTFATTRPLSGGIREFPAQGEIVLASAESRLRVTPAVTSSLEYAEYQIAASSTGAYGPARQVKWLDLFIGGAFNHVFPEPPQPPLVTHVSMLPASPTVESNVGATVAAYDANYDYLEYRFEWRRNGALVPGTTGSTLTGDQYRKGDVIEATAFVSDGVHTVARSTTTQIVNAAPRVSGATISPAAPFSSDPLSLVATITDADADPLQVSYLWRRNGATIPGETGPILPANGNRPNDVITGVISVSDGGPNVSTEVSAVVLDRPPRVTAIAPPTTVEHGAPVTFVVTAEDPDGDPVGDFELLYGPAGMTIDPSTGVVNWTASGPMFDRTMNVAWGITVDDPTAEPATGTLEVTDPNRDYALLRFSARSPTGQRAGLSIGDFDNDGDVETLIIGQRWLFELDADGSGSYLQTWAYPHALNIDMGFEYRSAVATGDADGDGLQEIFAVVGRTLTKLDGAERRPIGTMQLGPDESCDDLHYTDLENDGAADLLCLARSASSSEIARILVLRVTDLSLRYEFPPAAYGRSLAVGNVDSDVTQEIVTANGYVFDGATFVSDWSYAQGFGVYVDTGDLNGDDIEEIVATNGPVLRGYSATLPTPLWELVSDYAAFSSPLVADVAGTARPEILVGDIGGGNLWIYRYNTATNALDLVDQRYSEAYGTTAIGVGDVDDDGQREIIRGSRSGALNVLGLDPALTIEWPTSDPTLLDGPFRGGMLAGSPLESPAPLFLSLRTSSGFDGARLVRMPSNGAALEISAEINSNWAGVGALDVVDYDDDGTDEAFIASHAFYDGVFRAYDFFTGTSEWSANANAGQNPFFDVTHVDVTGDGKDELIGRMGSGVIVHDVYQQTVVWQSPTVYGGGRVLVADLDGAADAQREIVLVADYVALVYRQVPPPARFVQAGLYQSNRRIVDAGVGDSDGDGDAEVMLLVSAPGGAEHPSDVIKLDGSLQYAGAFTLPWPAQTLDIEPSPTPRKNLLISRRAAREDGQIAIVGARAGDVVSESPALVGLVQPGSVHYVTLRGETVPRISIGTSAGMYLTR